MKAMVLAAGKGKRMLPLTEAMPKVLLPVRGKPLVGYLLENLSAHGFKDIVMNVAHLPHQFYAVLGDGSHFGVKITYSVEENDLETGGGIVNALPLLGDSPFLVVSGDIWTDYPFSRLPTSLSGLAHLVLADNPLVKLVGDFGLSEGKVTLTSPEHIFASFGVYHPHLFSGCAIERFSVTILLKKAIANNQVTGELYTGQWLNVGTPELLDLINDQQQKN